MITIKDPGLCKKIKNLLRPKCKSIPMVIYVHDDSTTIVWKNQATYTAKVTINSIYVSNNTLELMFYNITNKESIGIISAEICVGGINLNLVLQNTTSCKEVVHLYSGTDVFIFTIIVLKKPNITGS